jgi:urease beta subunit
MIPGEYFLLHEPIEANSGRRVTTLIIRNTGDRPIQVGSHYHFFEVNRALIFEREKAFGTRLNIPAGTALRFEPGQEREVQLVEFRGTKTVCGLNGLTEGKIDDAETKRAALERAKTRGFGGAR